MSISQIEELTPLLDQKHLQFPVNLEAKFQAEYYENNLWINRIGLFVGLILYALFGFIDYYAMPVTYPQVWLIRYGIGIPLVTSVIVLSFFPIYIKLFRPLAALVTLTTGLSLIVIVRISQPNEVGYYYYIYGLMVILMFLYTVPGAQFRNVVWVSAIMILTFPLAYLSRSDFLKNQQSIIPFVMTAAFLVTLAIVGVISNYFFERSIRRNFIQRKIIEKEEEHSMTLLLNVLPASIAERLKRNQTIADYYPAVSVLFADIVNFTPISAMLQPVEVVRFLNHIFSEFDDLTEQRTLEKIKTIGDAYMVVSGLPVPRQDHAQVMADLALDMQEAIANVDLPNIRDLQVRIGIHSGPVIAGVIGWRKFAFDLWGDTINTASRMESHGLPGKIQVTQDYYELLKDRYDFEARGEIEVKGKGKMCVFFLTGKKTQASSPI